MSKAGIVILSGFAFFWLVLAKLNGASVSIWTLVLGLLISGAIILSAWLGDLQTRSLSPAESKKVGRIIMWSSIGEGIAIFAATQILTSIGMTDRFMAGIALAVGGHFVPIGIGLKSRPYLFLATVLLTLGLLGFLIASPRSAALAVGYASAAALWIMALFIRFRLSNASRALKR